jgi:hypothetical protein
MCGAKSEWVFHGADELSFGLIGGNMSAYKGEGSESRRLESDLVGRSLRSTLLDQLKIDPLVGFASNGIAV